VRHVFASAYLAYGNPVYGNPLAKKAEKLDALFEQQVDSIQNYILPHSCYY